MKQNNLTLSIYLVKKGYLKNRQSIYKEIKKAGAEGWAVEVFELLLKNDFVKLQEISKEMMAYSNLLELGVSVSTFLDKK